MRRWLFNFAAVLSLVLFLGTVVLWVRSYWTGESVSLERKPAISVSTNFWVNLRSERGKVCLTVGKDSPTSRDRAMEGYDFPPEARALRWKYFHIEWPPRTGTPVSANLFSFCGFGWERDEDQLSRSRSITLPDTFLILLSGILPVVWMSRFRARNQDGHCAVCSYNLTGNVSDVCPECGTPVAGKAGVEA